MALESDAKETLDWTVVRYSRVHEDHSVLSQALQVVPEQDIVLSITSSGDNVLNLLLDRPKKIVAIDLSIAQNAILELKLAAIALLDYHDFLVLLGVEEDPTHRRSLDLYESVRGRLPIYAQDYWDAHKELISSSLAECGRFERYIQVYANEHFHKFADRKWVAKFIKSDSLDEQKRLFDSLDLPELKKDFVQYTNKQSQSGGRSSAQLKYATEDAIAELWSRFYHVCTELPVKDNFYIGIWLQRNRPFNPSAAPPYLTPKGFIELKGLIDRVEVLTIAIEDYLSSCPIFHKANLSNIFEYMSADATSAQFAALASKMANNGRIAYWEAFVPRMPESNPLFTHLTELSSKLHLQDRVFYYCNFHVLQLNK